jgi:hypothetical protein
LVREPILIVGREELAPLRARDKLGVFEISGKLFIESKLDNISMF